MTPLPRPSMVRPVRKGKPPGRRSRRAERRLRSHSRALRAERSHRGKAPPTGFPLGSRTGLGGLQQTRLTRGVATSGKPLCVISAPVPRPPRRGRSRRQALCLCVTSIEPSGDNGQHGPERCRSRRFLLGASDRSGDEGAASSAGAAESHLLAHGRLPAAWLPHAGRHVRGLWDDPPPEQTAADLLRGLSGARFRRG